MSAMSDEQLKKEFRRVDKNNDGTISFEGSIVRSATGDLFLSFLEFKLFCSKT